jgi:3-phosphoshikimate 1-carboxyvinyltransferase
MEQKIEIIMPVSRPIQGSIRPPGSKSLTNRALAIAALAEGTSRLVGVLDSTDTRVMIESLNRLGIQVTHDPKACIAEVAGCGGKPPAKSADLWLENSGTSIRFLTALCGLGHGKYRLDGNARMRQRPVSPLVDALNSLGAKVKCETGSGCPPVVVESQGLRGGHASVAGNISSQFLSALLIAAPGANSAVELHISGELVSRPYVEMTLGVMAKFDVAAEPLSSDCYRIDPQAYRGTEYQIEPDASAASYFFAAAAITGGEITVEGLPEHALQGDVAFIDALSEMGCEVKCHADAITDKRGPLKGINIDMNSISDTAQTLACVAVFADGPTRISRIGHIRHKETDRISALATELRRLGLRVDDEHDALTVHPGPITPARIETYDDHRMAMSFALIGLKVPGIEISDPECTAKTYPRFFEDLKTLTASARTP